jgi:hypothetical protein
MALPKAAEYSAEATEKALAICMAKCAKLVDSMRVAKPAEAERMRSLLGEIIKATPKLALDFKRKMLFDAVACERNANVRAADGALNLAMEKARADSKIERNRLAGEARNFCNKAIALGAPATIRDTLNRKIEIIMMTGRA